MNIEFLRAALASGLFACAGFAHAAPAAVNQQWEVASVRVGFHSSVSSCIFSAIGATNAWNAVGADLYLPTDSLATHPRVSEQTQAFNYANITVEDADNVTPGAGMETRTTVNPNTGTILNADIYVDRKRMDQTPGVTQLICTTAPTIPADRFDGESALLHEFGHAVGFDHGDDSNCPMYPTMPAGQVKRVLCEAEMEEYLWAYGLPFKILSLANVSGPQGVNIPASVHYQGNPAFPVKRKTKIVQCASGWTCSDYNGTYTSATPSPLTFNFRCTNTSPLPTATFRWRTTLTDANGVVTNAVEHTSTCTRPAGTIANASRAGDGNSANRIVITP